MSFSNRFNNVKFYAASFDAELAVLDKKLQKLKVIFEDIKVWNSASAEETNVAWHTIEGDVKAGLSILEELSK